jgi:hypothetical protein
MAKIAPLTRNTISGIVVIGNRGQNAGSHLIYSNPCRSHKFFTPPQPSPYQGEGVRNSQMI